MEIPTPKHQDHPHSRSLCRQKWSTKNILRALVCFLCFVVFLRILISFSSNTLWPETSGTSPSTSDPQNVPSQKRRRNVQESSGTVQKKARGDSSTQRSGTSGSAKEPEAKEPKRLQKQTPRIQSAIYASHKISSSFDISHTINLTLIGMRMSF